MRSSKFGRLARGRTTCWTEFLLKLHMTDLFELSPSRSSSTLTFTLTRKPILRRQPFECHNNYYHTLGDESQKISPHPQNPLQKGESHSYSLAKSILSHLHDNLLVSNIQGQLCSWPPIQNLMLLEFLQKISNNASHALDELCLFFALWYSLC